MRAGISFHRGPPASDVIFQHPIMEDPPSLLVDSNSPWQIPYSPLISEEPAKDKGKGDLRRALLHLTDLDAKRSAYVPGAYETDTDPTPNFRLWAGEVADARNGVVHPTVNVIPSERIRGYAEHVYRLVVLALLERIGINPEVVARLDYETNIPDFHSMGPWANVSR